MNNALAARDHRDGLLARAEKRLERAVARLVRRNPNPYDGEAHYLLGVVKRDLGKLEDADRCFAKAAWNAAWKVPAELALARLAARRNDWPAVLERSLAVSELDREQRQAAALSVLALRRLGRDDEADALLRQSRTRFRIDWWLADLAGEESAASASTLIDVALEYADLGLLDDADRVLAAAADADRRRPVEGEGRQLPLVQLHRAHLHLRRGNHAAAREFVDAAERADRRTCFPGRLADALVLTELRCFAPTSPVVAALLGHWLYSRGRVEDAVEAWNAAPADPVAARNLAVAAYNHGADAAAAVRGYERALALAPDDARLWYERDQLAKRLGEPLAERLARLEPRREAVAARDDLTVEYARLLVGVGRAAEARTLLAGRLFQPWEGGEGQVLEAWEDAALALARDAVDADDPDLAVRLLEDALNPPPNLGEARHLLANTAHLDLALGDALAAAGRHADAERAWQRASRAQGDFVAMATTDYSERSVFSAIALQRLGRHTEASDLASAMTAWAERRRDEPATIDYFATSLPTLLLFHEDLQVRQALTCDVLQAQAAFVLGEDEVARRLVRTVLDVDPAEPFARQLALLLAPESRLIH